MEKNNKSTSDLFTLFEAIYQPSLHLEESQSLSEKKPFFTTTYLKGLKRVLESEYFKAHSSEIIQGLKKATSRGQLQSKEWILKVLKEKGISNLGIVALCAGWYGFLAFLFFRDSFFSTKNIFLFEIDELSVKVSEDINRYFVKDNWKFKATLKNILDIHYAGETFTTLKFNGESEKLTMVPDTIINTSCEHIEKFKEWWDKIPAEKLIILQSNNYKGLKEHVNCVSSLEEFKKMASMGRLIYEGHLDLEKYTRFMLIGYKT